MAPFADDIAFGRYGNCSVYLNTRGTFYDQLLQLLLERFRKAQRHSRDLSEIHIEWVEKGPLLPVSC